MFNMNVISTSYIIVESKCHNIFAWHLRLSNILSMVCEWKLIHHLDKFWYIYSITGAPVSEKGSPDWVPSVFNFPSSQHASNVGIGGVKRAERAQQRSAQKQHASLHLSASSGDQDEMFTAEEPVSQVSYKHWLLRYLPVQPVFLAPRSR